jgi:hypothetical protein
MKNKINPYYTQQEIDLRFLGNDLYQDRESSEELLIIYDSSFVFRERTRPIIQQCILEAIKNETP